MIGGVPITIKDIATLSGVAISTVSRVLNNRPDVSDETRRKVMDIVGMHNYTQNANAKNLKQRNTNLATIIVRGRQNSFLTDIAEKINEYGNNRKQKFLLDFIDEQADEFETARQHIAERKVKGVIFLGSNPVNRRDEIASLRLPCVFATVDTSALSLPSVSSVSVDNCQGAKGAIDYLIDNGHRRIAVFGGDRTVEDGLGKRYQGVLMSFGEHGLTFDEFLYVECPFTMVRAYQAASRFLDANPKFTAVFAMSDTMAIGIMKALHDRGLRVPEDISVVGFDGIPLTRFTLPTLTTIAQPSDDIARESVSLMLRLFEDPNDSEDMVVASMLVAGDSVRCFNVRREFTGIVP